MQGTIADQALKKASLDKLYRHQSQEAESCKQRLKQWTKFRGDYLTLKSRLTELPNKVSHQVMVPFGPRAFFPGHLKHTNEIMVLLGDNWFVEQSAKQASAIVDRRLKQCDEMLEGLAKELKLTENWKENTKMLFEEAADAKRGVEIIETEEEGWRQEHRKKVEEYKQKLAKMKRSEDEGPVKSEEDLWRRLDELELEEELQQELDLLSDEEEEDEEGEENDNEEEEQEKEEGNLRITVEDVSTNDPVEALASSEERSESDSEKKRVTWSESDSVRQFQLNEVLARHPSKEDESCDVLKLTFKHSKEVGRRTRIAMSSEETGEASDVVSSPSDIFRKFYSSDAGVVSCGTAATPEPKSILKVKKSTTPIVSFPDSDSEEAPRPAVRRQVVVEDAPDAVGLEVLERTPSAPAQQATDVQQVNTHRPVSRFKASRMNRK